MRISNKNIQKIKIKEFQLIFSNRMIDKNVDLIKFHRILLLGLQNQNFTCNYRRKLVFKMEWSLVEN